jgi:hypothetical protein
MQRWRLNCTTACITCVLVGGDAAAVPAAAKACCHVTQPGGTVLLAAAWVLMINVPPCVSPQPCMRRHQRHTWSAVSRRQAVDSCARALIGRCWCSTQHSCVRAITFSTSCA